jgi:DNA polymerase-1
MKKRLAVIDGKSVFYRGYYSMPGLALADGTPTGGVFGFTSLAIELIKKIKPDYVAVAWDKKGTNIRKRLEIYPEYKSGRKKAPDDFYAQIPILYELLEAFGWPLYEIDDYEADDIMGAFARQASEKGIETYLITSDLDALQLINKDVKVFALKNGFSNLEEFDVEHFENKYGINVHQFLDLKSLQGDSSDNLPGVPGIGPKTGIELLQKYGTIDGIYEHLDDIKPTVAKRLADGKQKAYMTKELARIWSEAPVELDWAVADVNDTDLDRVAEILKRLEFTSLVRRLPEHMKIISKKTVAEIENDELLEVMWPEVLDLTKPIVMAVYDDEIWLSVNAKTVSHIKSNEVEIPFIYALKDATVISYDSKILYHQLKKVGIEVEFKEVYDIHQSAFLIDSLSRDRTLSALLGLDVSEKPRSIIAATWAVYDKQVKILDGNEKLRHVAHEFDFPLTYTLFKMEDRGIKIDSEFLLDMSQKLGAEYRELESEIYTLVGYEFNIGSPMQLSEVLFTKLQLPTAGIKKGKTAFSTGQKELNKLKGQHPIIELIERTRELAKLKSTYVDTLPVMTDERGRIHTTFNQDITSTGRLSSVNPNLQNIPIRSELGKRIRKAFIPEKGKVFVGADYSQFELRLAAVLAGDEELINDFNSGVDIHTKTASEVYCIPIDDVSKNQRRNAKVINFGVLYGMSPHGLVAATGMSFGEAKKFIEQYFELRQPIRKYIDKTLEDARVKGYVETYFGRRRPTPDVLSSNFMVRSSAERAAANMPIQGTEADLMKLAMIKVDERLGDLGEQILQIHDSILIECPIENAEKVSEILRETMENIAPELGIKLKVDVAIGKNWEEL